MLFVRVLIDIEFASDVKKLQLDFLDFPYAAMYIKNKPKRDEYIGEYTYIVSFGVNGN